MSTIKKWKKEEIRFNMEMNNTWLLRGLLAIYDRQTADEKNDGITKHENGVGFSGVDSNFLTNLALSYKQFGRLTKPQIDKLRPAMLKYAGQLAKIANGLL